MSDVIVWVDVETSGLNPWTGPSERRHLLEVACLVTDTDLNILDEEGFEATVSYSSREVERIRSKAQKIVREMHDANGLWERVAGDEGLSLGELDQALLSYVAEFAPESRLARLGGNSVRLDLNFLEAYLPMTYGHLHYRFLDVTTVSTLLGWWGNVPRFEKRGNHTAMSDIRESIEELRHLRGFVNL